MMTILDSLPWSFDEIDLAIARLAEPPAQRFNAGGDLRQSTLDQVTDDALEQVFSRAAAHIDTPVKRTKPHVRVLVALAAAAVFVTAVSFITFGSRSRALAATPPLLQITAPEVPTSARQMLESIAGTIDRQTIAPGSGAIAYRSTRTWSLFTEINNGSANSEVVPRIEKRWQAADGSGRVESSSSRGLETATDHEPGDLVSMWPLGSLSGDEAELDLQLQQSHRWINTVQGRFDAIRDAALSMPLSGEVRASLLRFLAATPSLKFDGTATDRIGRSGLAFSAESSDSGLPTRYTVIVDQSTGDFLDFETSLTTSAGGLNVSVPAVIGYDAIVESKYVPGIGD